MDFARDDDGDDLAFLSWPPAVMSLHLTVVAVTKLFENESRARSELDVGLFVRACS